MGLVKLLVSVSVEHSASACDVPYLPTGGLSRLSCIFLFACSRYVVLTGLDLPTRPSLVPKERLNMVSKSNLGDCRFQIIERVKCSWEGMKGRENANECRRERGLSLTLDHKSTMWELRSLFNDSSDRRFPRREKTDETKKTSKRLDVQVLQMKTRTCSACSCVTRKEKDMGSHLLK